MNDGLLWNDPMFLKWATNAPFTLFVNYACNQRNIKLEGSTVWKCIFYMMHQNFENSRKSRRFCKNSFLSSKMTRIQFNVVDHDVYCNIKYYVTRCLTNYVTKSWILVCKANPKEPYLRPEFWIRYLWRRTVHVINSII